MDKIYLTKWENVLLEWVNCLKLSAPIKNLQELKDGNFFTNLFKLFSPVNVDTPKHIFVIIYEFLREQYPHFSLNYDKGVNMQDLDGTELIIISSLLLHYSCIHDRRDVLTSPLCYQLSKTTQTVIKMYLENTQNDISRDDFFNAIKTSINSEQINSKHCTLTCSYSNPTSPLQAFLCTPISKVPRLRDKDRLINKLRSEVDSERFEKLDLQKELSDQKERNRNLSQQIQNKTIEITKLHIDMSELENKFASNNSNNEWSELQQTLRHEINSLEVYISQLHSEQEKLSEEKDKIKEQVKQLQGECNFWKEKAISFETNYETLSETHKQQTFELHNLRHHCTELSGLLEEFQSTKRVNDTCEEGDLSVADSYQKMLEDSSSVEELACAVVEVQLRDVQKENLELNNSLKDCQDNIIILNNEIYNCKIKMRQLEDDKDIVESENRELQSKVTVLIKTREMLDKTKNQLEQTTIKLQDVLNHNELLTSNVIIKDKQLIETQDVLQSLRVSNTVTTTNLQTLEQDYQNLQNNLKKCEEQLITAQTDYNNATQCLKELNTNLETILDKFKTFLYGSFKLDVTNFQAAFTTILDELDNERRKQQKDKKSLLDNMARLEKLVVMQKTELVALNEQEEHCLKEINELTNNLKTTKEDVAILEETITRHVDKIKNLNSTISEMKLVQIELDTSKVNLEEKILNLERKIQDCTNNEEMVKNVVFELRTDINEQSLGFGQYLNILQFEITRGVETINNLRGNLEKAHGVLAQHKLSEDKLQKALEEKSTKLQNVETQLEEITEKLRVTLETKKSLTKQLSASKANYEREILHLKDCLKTIEERLENVKDAEFKLTQQLKENDTEIDVLKGVVALKKIDLYEKDKEIKSYQNQINSLKKQNDGLRAENKNLNKLCFNLENMKQSLEKKCEELETNIRNVVDELTSKNEVFNAIVIKNKDNINELSQTKAELNVLTNLNEENKEKASDYENKILKLNHEIDLFGNREKEYVNEIRRTKDELNVLTKLNEENRDKASDYQNKILKLNHEVDLFANKEKEYVNELSETKDELNVLTKLNEENKEKASDYENKILKLSHEIDLFANKEKGYINEVSQTKDELNVLTKLIEENKEKATNYENKILKLNHEIDLFANKQKKYINELSQTKDKLNVLTKLIEENKEKATNYENKILQLSHEIDLFANKEKEYINELSQTKDELNVLTKLIEENKEKASDYENKILKFNHEIDLFANKEKEYINEVSQTKDELNVLTKLNEENKEKASDYENKILKLNHEIDLFANKEKEYINELSQTKDELNVMTKLNEENKEKASDYQNKILKLNHEVDLFANKEKEYVNELRETKEELNVMTKLNEENKEKASDYENKILKLNHEIDLFANKEKEYINELSQTKDELNVLTKLNEENKEKASDYENKILKLNHEIDLFANKEKEYINELSQTKDEFNVLTKLNEENKEKASDYENKILKLNHEINLFAIKEKEHINELSQTKDELNVLINLNEMNKEKASDLEKQIEELNYEIDLFANREKEYVNELSQTKDELNVTIAKYTEVLQTHQELQVDSEAQINNLTENLHELVKKYNCLDNVHQETIEKLNNTDKNLEDYKQNEIKLKEDVRNQQVKFDDELNNFKKEKDAEFTQSLTKAVDKLHASEKKNKEIYNSFQKLCIVVAYEKSHADKLRKTVTHIFNKYKKLKDSFEELKRDLQLSDIPENLNNLNVKLSYCLKTLIDENNSLNKSNCDLQGTLAIMQNDCENLKLNFEILNQKDEEIMLFKEENKAQNEALNVLIKEKEQLLEEVHTERKRFDDLSANIEDYELKLNECKRLNDVFEAAKKNEIVALEGLIKRKDEDIKALTAAIDSKNGVVEEVNTKNDNFVLELSNLKESVNSFKYLEQVLEEERGAFAEQKVKITEDLVSAHREIENWKEKVKTVFVERQALELEIKVANEKIAEYESFLRTKETDIGDANTKLVTKLEEILNLEKCKQSLQVQVEQLAEKLNQVNNENRDIKKSYERVCEDAKTARAKLQEGAADKVSVIHDTCEKFAGYSRSFKTAIDKLVTERNFVETIIGNLRQSLMSLQTKSLEVNNEREGLKLKEQVESFEFVVEDLQKQFVQISKKIHTIILNIIGIPAKIYDIIVTEKFAETSSLFESTDFEEELEKIADCRNSANDLLDQMNNFEVLLAPKLTKINKENILKSSSNVNSDGKVKDEDLKKKNTVLKQRLTLSENAKGNLEKKIKQLRQEKKLLQEKSDNNMEMGYKTLLQQHIELKEKLSKSQEQRLKLLQDFENYKIKHIFQSNQIKHEKHVKSENENKLEKDVVKLRAAYGNLMSDNSKLDIENATLRKLLDDRNVQLSESSLIKEAYEKLLEENNTLRMELDTIKYKRNKDREGFYEANKKTQELKIEYEVKLQKMKDKTVQLYREEMNKENQKYQNEKVLLLNKIKQLEKKRVTKFKEFDSGDVESYSSGESFFITADASHLQSTRNSFKTTDDLTSSRNRRADDRKCATLPKTTGMLVIRESRELQRSAQPRLEMEDEDNEVFNNKYLGDLKEGRCILPSERESNVDRLSELKWRNSLYPPHLKSCYPAETQFSSPSQFKEDDIKSGVVEFDDSMNTKLLHGEKPRKKDIGTTSYKKPGPPTPSKNGGRMSLQGNERDMLREQNNDAPKTPKRNTPSRFKNLFMGRSLSTKDNSENQAGTPRSKRLSIFRRQK